MTYPATLSGIEWHRRITLGAGLLTAGRIISYRPLHRPSDRMLNKRECPGAPDQLPHGPGRDRWRRGRGPMACGRTELVPDGPTTMLELLAAGHGASMARSRAGRPERILADGRPTADLELLAPVPRPGKVVAIGRNYGHMLRRKASSHPNAPLIFAKWPSAVMGSGCCNSLGSDLTSQVDYEAELAVVIGRPARHVSGSRCARLRRRLHLPQRRFRAGPPVRRRAMGPRQVARHVLPDGSGAGHGRRDPRPAGPGDLLLRGRRARPGRQYFADVLQRCRDRELLLPGIHPGAG